MKKFLITEVLTSSEADERWGKPSGTVRVSCNRGRFNDYIERGLVRKSSGTWLVTEMAMREVFGERKSVQTKGDV